MKETLGEKRLLKMNNKRPVNETSSGDVPKRVKVTPALTSLKDAQFVKVLNEDLGKKTTFLQMKLPLNETLTDAVVIFERKPFKQEDMLDICSEKTYLNEEMKNDAYGTYSMVLPQKFCDAKATVICPATEKHIAKYSKKSVWIIKESKEDYETITRPMIDSQFEKKVFNLNWIYNILDGKAEKEKVLYNDPDPVNGFVIVLDFKWTGEDSKLLHCLGLPKRKDLRSIRDLTKEHVSLLKAMKLKALEVFKSKYQVDASSLKAYFHYQPSFYHLHIHFSNVDSGLDHGTDAWRAHLLDDVIDNLDVSSDYYRNKTLSFILGENDALSVEFKKARNQC